MGTSLKKKLKVMSPLGLHARPASMFVRIANKFECDILVHKDGRSVNGKSIMGILMLAAEQGCDIEVEALGEDAFRAVDEIEKFLSRADGNLEGPP